MNLDEIKALIEMLKDTDITDLQVETGDAKVRLKREKHFTSIELPRYGAAAQPGYLPEQPAGGGRPASAPVSEDTQRLITVTAPLVGTFYRAGSPDNPFFVEVGDRVKKGQVLCIVEAMKLMNEIESDVDGVLVKCLVDNASPVEYGEPLFLIEPH